VRGSFVFLDKKNYKSSTIPLEGKEYICIERLICLFLLLTQLMTELPLKFEKSKADYGSALVFLDWFFLLCLDFDRGVLVILGLRVLLKKNHLFYMFF